MTAGKEYELKYALAADNFAALQAHPLIAPAMADSRTSRLVNSYFDTPDGTLWDQGITLRIRDQDGEKTETLKQSGALFVDRGEWNSQTDAATPDLHRLRKGPLGVHFRKSRLKDDLGPRFTLHVDRTTFTLVYGASSIEAALDCGHLDAEGKTLPISEFELELKDGEPADLLALGRQLVNQLPLEISPISKAERGFRLLDGSWGHAVKDNDFAVEPKMPSTEAFQALADACLHQFMLNREAFTVAPEIETVHRARIALRRLRALIGLFKPRVKGPDLELLKPEIKWIWRLLGEARDLDVFQSEVFDPAATREHLAGGKALADHMREKQIASHQALQHAFDSGRWRLLAHDLVAWIALGDWMAEAPAHDPVRSFARKRLRHARKDLLKSSRDLSGLDATARHQVRIDAKTLRYCLEFFRTTDGLGDGSSEYRDLLVSLEHMQEALGAIHDQEAKQELLHAEGLVLASSDAPVDPEELFTVGLLAGRSQDCEGLIRKAREAHHGVELADPF